MNPHQYGWDLNFILKKKQKKTQHVIRGAGGRTYLIILFPLWAYSLIIGWGSKPGRGSNIFGPLQDQQRLSSIRRSDLLVGHAISLNKKCANWGGGGINNFRSDKNIWTHLGGSLTSNWATSQIHPLPLYN